MVARGIEPWLERSFRGALKELLLLVATTSPGAVPLLSQILGFDESIFVCVDPEQPNPKMERVEEPKGESKLAVLFKIWRAIIHLPHVDIHHGNFFIFSADVEVKVNGNEQHRFWRDSSVPLTEDEEEQLTQQVIKMYSKPTHIEWRVTMGVAIGDEVRVTAPFVIYTEFQDINPEIVQKYLNLKSNTGMKSVELGKVLGNTFYICDEKGEEQHEISADQAYQLIVEKVPLNLQMLAELILSEAVHQEHDLLSGLPYYTVAVNL